MVLAKLLPFRTPVMAQQAPSSRSWFSIDWRECLAKGAIGAVGAVPGTILAHPADVVKMRMQTNSSVWNPGLIDTIAHVRSDPHRIRWCVWMGASGFFAVVSLVMVPTPVWSAYETKPASHRKTLATQTNAPDDNGWID